MNKLKKITTGSIVTFRDREWIVYPESDEDITLLKPLDGVDSDITGIYHPLKFNRDEVTLSAYPKLKAKDIGDFTTAKLLYDATRLGFRSASGPFRCLAKLAFTPRSYQLIPLIMALKQPETVRLLIADDVGIGKTIEALLIVKEFLERGEIERFAIITPPQLCEQWHAELKDKFGIDAVIIRSNTQAKLDREMINTNESVYSYYPYQVISIDYIKSDTRVDSFVNSCPELVVVDEAHTCTISNLSDASHHQRYNLVKKIAAKPKQHLVLLTATPHSGKKEQFNSLLGHLNESYRTTDFTTISQKERENLAKHFVQRRRADVTKWMDEDTPFPERSIDELSFKMTDSYKAFFDDFSKFLLNQDHDKEDKGYKFKYWAALSLLRGFSSSPETALNMLKNRLTTNDLNSAEDLSYEVFDGDYDNPDYSPISSLSAAQWSDYQKRKLVEFKNRIEALDYQEDYKAQFATEKVKEWLQRGFIPLVFCRYIATAHYLGARLKEWLSKDFPELKIEVITSESPDELRKEIIDEMKPYSLKVLVATDCLSEGINLQDQFTAVLHYDLPWNPNRLEQREGRVDRFGQNAPKVESLVIYCSDNPIDEIVLKVLIRKIRYIRKSIGVTIAFPGDSKSLIDTIMNEFVELQSKDQQAVINFSEQHASSVSKQIEEAKEMQLATRDIFAQNSIKVTEIETDLKSIDLIIGSQKNVESFVTYALPLFNSYLVKTGKGYSLETTNLPDMLKFILPQQPKLRISFESPTPVNHLYIGRAHPLVESLCRLILADSISSSPNYGISRVSVIRTKEVELKTTIIVYRVRNVIQESRSKKKLVAEEMLLWGYHGDLQANKRLSQSEAQQLLYEVKSSSNITPEASWNFVIHELERIQHHSEVIDDLARERAEKLVEAHERFRKATGGKRYIPVKPVLPMDLMGLYILIPEVKEQ